MSPHERRACHDLAVRLLRDYRLSTAERAEETRRLADTIETAVSGDLENLEHRKGTELL